MSILALKSRPWAVFDVSNKEHRRWYWQFVQHGSWGRCPYRLIVPDDQGDLITMIQRTLVKYYVEREFVAKIPQNTSNTKVLRKKSVKSTKKRLTQKAQFAIIEA